MQSQTNALIALLSQTQDNVLSKFCFDEALACFWYDALQVEIDNIRYRVKNGEDVMPASAFALIDEVASL